MFNAMMKLKPFISKQVNWDESRMDFMIKMYSNPWFLCFVINLFYLLLGFFLSVLIALFVRTPIITGQNEK